MKRTPTSARKCTTRRRRAAFWSASTESTTSTRTPPMERGTDLAARKTLTDARGGIVSSWVERKPNYIEPFRGPHYKQRASIRKPGLRPALEEALEEEKKKGGPPAEDENSADDSEEEESTARKDSKRRSVGAKRKRKRESDDGDSGGTVDVPDEEMKKRRKRLQKIKRKSMDSGEKNGKDDVQKASEGKTSGVRKRSSLKEGDTPESTKKRVKREASGNGTKEEERQKEKRRKKREERQSHKEKGEKKQKKPMDEATIKAKLTLLHSQMRKAVVQKSVPAYTKVIARIKATPITIKILHVKRLLPPPRA